VKYGGPVLIGGGGVGGGGGGGGGVEVRVLTKRLIFEITIAFR